MYMGRMVIRADFDVVRFESIVSVTFFIMNWIAAYYLKNHAVSQPSALSSLSAWYGFS
jgi:hypothetical protein